MVFVLFPCPPYVRLGSRALAAGNGCDSVQEHRQTVVDAMCLSDRGVVRHVYRSAAKRAPPAVTRSRPAVSDDGV